MINTIGINSTGEHNQFYFEDKFQAEFYVD